jgi:hypothetical protein
VPETLDLIRSLAVHAEAEYRADRTGRLSVIAVGSLRRRAGHWTGRRSVSVAAVLPAVERSVSAAFDERPEQAAELRALRAEAVEAAVRDARPVRVARSAAAEAQRAQQVAAQGVEARYEQPAAARDVAAGVPVWLLVQAQARPSWEVVFAPTR